MYKTTADRMTAQELCDYSVKAMVKQGKRCYSEKIKNCIYSDGKGNHCAIGLITNPKQHKHWDKIGDISHIIHSKKAKGIPKPIRDNHDVFYRLQCFHDAEGQAIRQFALSQLKELGIKTHRVHWQKWVNLGVSA